MNVNEAVKGEVASRPYARFRVIELPGSEAMLFGRTFADLGAEVIKVEPPGGDAARSLPPFQVNGSGTSLYWQAYAAGKRSVRIELDSSVGRDLVRHLATCSDVMVESFAPGTLDALGIGYDQLRACNPALVLTSITPFGQTGPYALRKGSDLVHFAMSGYLNMTGPPDGAPIKPSAPYQTFFHGSMQAVAATLLALRNRRRMGRGTHVDQAMRDTGLWMLTHTYQFWDLLRVNLRRQGASRDMGGVLRLPSVWKALDGYIVWLFQTGHIGGQRMYQLVEWMNAEGLAPEWMRSVTWESFDLLSAGPDANRRLTDAFAAFFATKHRAELFEWALARGMMLAPVQRLSDVAADLQLAERGAWRTQQGPDGYLRVPGPPVRLGLGDWEPRGVAPELGADDDAILGGLLGLFDPPG